MKLLHSALFAALLCGAASGASATTLDFEDLTGSVSQIAGGYQGFTWSNFYDITKSYLPATGYDYGTVSGVISIFNAYGSPASLASSSDFTLNSFYATAAWGAMDLILTAYNDGVQVFSGSYALNTTTPTLISLDWAGVDYVTFSSSINSQFAVDDLSFNQAASAVPLPAAAPLLIAGLGAMGVASRRRRRTEA
ncbi:MAG: VPLPA-CTERM sorting domain-containing protein [Paracoccaceae bacterium]